MKHLAMLILTLIISFGTNASSFDPNTSKCKDLSYLAYDVANLRNQPTFWEHAANGTRYEHFLHIERKLQIAFSSIREEFEKSSIRNQTPTIESYLNEGINLDTVHGRNIYQARLKKLDDAVITQCYHWLSFPLMRAATLAIGRVVAPLD